MENLTRKAVKANLYPEKIIQFGEGNFLRAFVDWIVFNMNNKADFNASIVVVQPIQNGMIDMLNDQDGLYHLNLQGVDKGEKIDSIEMIDVISRGINPYRDFQSYMDLAINPEMRFVVSNTTEAGITFDPKCNLDDAPASSFPGKLTQLLYARFNYFKGDMSKGLHIFPCELIFHNGKELNKAIQQYIAHWNLGEEFKNWYENACGVYSTLVDRIVPGYPKDTIDEILDRVQLNDKLVVKAEIFHLWVIEAPESVAAEFPADKAGLNVLFVPDEKPYHERKVTLLNAPHTALAAVGYLSGIDTVREVVEDETLGQFVDVLMAEELMKTLDLPEQELKDFAAAVIDRFRNPFVRHFVTSIMLNAFPKFKARNLPRLKLYNEREGEHPHALILGLASIIEYYKGGKRFDGAEIPVTDDVAIVNLLQELWATGDIRRVVTGVLAAEIIWEEDLNKIDGLNDHLVALLSSIEENGMLETVKTVLKEDNILHLIK